MDKEEIKKESRSFIDSLKHVLFVLFLVFCIGFGAWSFIDVILPTSLWDDVLKPFAGLLFWAVVIFVFYFVKEWWSNRKQK
jgi:O-antigen/teichoic acid export membrane protein